jgi:hypothetical protein
LTFVIHVPSSGLLASAITGSNNAKANKLFMESPALLI